MVDDSRAGFVGDGGNRDGGSDTLASLEEVERLWGILKELGLQ